MAPKPSLRRQSGAGRSARSRKRGGGGEGAKIQLRDGKQLTLPSWMSFLHLPEYGIVSSSQSSSKAAAAQSAGEGADMSVGNEGDERSARQSRRGKRSRDESNTTAISDAPTAAKSASQASKASNLSAYTAPQVVASNYKEKKKVAEDSLYPPTVEEIHGHIRYLSEEGMRLVSMELDDCVGYSLRYSATKARGERGVTGYGSQKKQKPKHDLVTLAAELNKYFDKFQPESEDDEEETATPSQPTANGRMQPMKSDPIAILREDILRDILPQKYEPTLLPIATIKCYPNILDRVEMTKGLLSDLSQRNETIERTDNGKSACICRINSSSDLVQQGHIMTEIISQCISNDPRGEGFAMELQRQRKRQKSHHHGGVNRGVLIRSVWDWTRSLVEWAGFTEAFDSVVVILEDPEKIPSPLLDSFFTTLASLRSDHGVPIGVVVIDATPGGLGDRLSELRGPSLRGTSGVVVHDFHVPLPQVQLEIFVERLFAGNCIPSFLWTNGHLLRHIYELFLECDNSIVSVARQLKSDFRRQFSVPGAFTSMLNCDKFVVPNEARIKWLVGDEQCRSIMSLQSSATPVAAKDQKGSNIVALFWNMQMSYLCHQIYHQIYTIFDVSPLLGKIGQVAGADFHWSARMRELLSLLRDARKKISTWSDARASFVDRSALLCKEVNEYIILVGKFAADDEADTTMATALVEDMLSWLGKQFLAQATLEDIPTVQPRRDVARALSVPPPKDLMQCSLAHASRIAFQVFQSRVMTLAEWHEKYFDVVADQDGHIAGVTSNEAAFFFAVYELVHCGFVKKLPTGRRKEEAYEKVAMVWSSGR